MFGDCIRRDFPAFLKSETLRAAKRLDMRATPLHLVIASVFAVLCAAASGQNAPTTPAVPDPAAQGTLSPASSSDPTPAPVPVAPSLASTSAPASSAVQILQSFRDSDVKFDLRDLMDTLRDKRHEGWVLAAYPDPKTGHPLIGAGFTLDLPERPHTQPDPLNAHPFLEPSSADLWRAAGLDPDRLDAILDQYQERFAAWKKKGFRRRIPTLAPQISDDDASQLLRISAIQAVYNARAYCRNFDRLTGPQQMALSQLVYQIGVNLVHFDDFLAQINDGVPASAVAADAPAEALAFDHDYWQSVQHTLMQTQWAHLYRTRAIAVIAMLDPSYADSPAAAEHLVGASLRPAVAHRHRGHSATLNQVASKSTHPRGARKRKARARPRRKA
jgi:GH24 family phage-related lysozyme (muramidase)